MKKRTIAGLIAIVAIASVAIFVGCVEKEVTPSTPTSQNLLVNPGAEEGDETDWIHTKEFCVTKRQPQKSGDVKPHTDSYFFSMASSPGSYGRANQTVDLSDYAFKIDRGDAKINVGVWTQNEYLGGANADSCKLTIQYLNVAGNVLKESTTGEIVHQKGNFWDKESFSEIIPKNTRSVIYTLEGTLHYGKYINAFFDDAYLYVS